MKTIKQKKTTNRKKIAKQSVKEQQKKGIYKKKN